MSNLLNATSRFPHHSNETVLAALAEDLDSLLSNLLIDLRYIALPHNMIFRNNHSVTRAMRRYY